MKVRRLVHVVNCIWLVTSHIGLPRHLCAQAERALADRPPNISRVLMSGEIDESRQTVLKGNTHPIASYANDHGAVSTDLVIHRMLIVLRRSPEREEALAALLVGQQTPTASKFHQWLSPGQFGAEFGLAQEDVQTVTNWLSSHGFTDIGVSKGRDIIEFSGNAGQIRTAFHTEIHRYEFGGVMHIANQRDPSIPTALVPVVAGIVSLNDFGRRSMAIRGPTLRSTKDQPLPQIASNTNPYYTQPGPNQLSSFFGVGAYDFASIYDLLPLWNIGLDGTGQTIAIVGETDINVSDAGYFRAFMGLPVNNPTVLIAGADPGVQADELESDLDVEWSGAVAKGAHIELVSAASTETTPGVDLAALYIVDNDLVPVMSESYGECELFLGTTANAFEKAMWQQAAAQGITVLVS
jgi:subtilase family serine protease